MAAAYLMLGRGIFEYCIARRRVADMINSGCWLLLWILVELSTMRYLSKERDPVLGHSDRAVPAS